MSHCFDYDFQKWTVLSLGLTAATLIVGLVLMQVGHGQTNNTKTNATRSYLNCFTGTMQFFLNGIIFAPPEVKFNKTDLTSPEVKQYISDGCKFYHEKSGVWLTGTLDELDRKILDKYGAEFMQKFKEPDALKQRDEAYAQLNKTK
jgi:hypothetical protein